MLFKNVSLRQYIKLILFTKALLSSLKYVNITNRSFQLSIIQDIFYPRALQHKRMFSVLSRFYPWVESAVANREC